MNLIFEMRHCLIVGAATVLALYGMYAAAAIVGATGLVWIIVERAKQ
jgi:hypothetical protein